MSRILSLYSGLIVHGSVVVGLGNIRGQQLNYRLFAITLVAVVTFFIESTVVEGMIFAAVTFAELFERGVVSSAFLSLASFEKVVNTEFFLGLGLFLSNRSGMPKVQLLLLLLVGHILWGGNGVFFLNLRDVQC